MKIPFFHNTTRLEAKELAREISNAYNQNKMILALFQHEKRALSPYDVLHILEHRHQKVCINSVRRAMTDLTKKGLLRKTNLKSYSIWGKKNYLWELS